MANTNPSAEPSPPMSATELRRRLLASAPPVAPATPVELEAVPTPGPVGAWGQEMLSRLRAPNKPASVEVTPEPVSNGAFPHSAKRPGRLQGLDSGGYPALTDTTPPGSGVRGLPAPRVPLDGIAGGNPYRDDPAASEVQRLKAENREIRQLLAEMKHLLQEASETEQKFATREQELQAELADRQRQVDELHSQLQGIEEQITSGSLTPAVAQAAPKTRTELEEWADELERDSSKLTLERRKLDEERQQLRDDEESLERQMREMEVGMARERALMARQEIELKRLSAEIQHELDVMQRGDASLREHMQKFQRRAQDVMQGKVGGGAQNGAPARK
jgi:hypothetical protein